ncbi:MAG: RibD family protein [Pseudomonadota bacterium]
MILDETLWQQMLALRQQAAGITGPDRCVCCTPTSLTATDTTHIDARTRAVICCSPQAPSGWQCETLLEARLWLWTRPDCEPALRQALRIYAPLALASWVSADQSFVLVHMAQSLDGRVSTVAGHSQWIGNEDNLQHAHRLRALVDGVLVGGKTAIQDKPRLNVRRVSGNDPVRILLSDSETALEALPRVPGMRTLVLRSRACEIRDAEQSDHEVLPCTRRDGTIDVPELLTRLREAGIHSVLVEGGPKTFRAFHEANAVDWLQLHVAPVLFGSGHPVLELPEITTVDDAVTLKHPVYTVMGNAFMVTAEL